MITANSELLKYSGILGTSSAIKWLNRFGLRHMVPSVRRRRMYLLGLRILNGTFDFSKNLHMTKKSYDELKSVLQRIKDSKIDKNLTYQVKTPKVYLNRVFEEAKSRVEEEIVESDISVKVYYKKQVEVVRENVEKTKEKKRNANADYLRANFERRERKRREKRQRMREALSDPVFAQCVNRFREKLNSPDELRVLTAPIWFGLIKIPGYCESKEKLDFLLSFAKQETWDLLDQPDLTYTPRPVDEEVLRQPDYFVEKETRVDIGEEEWVLVDKRKKVVKYKDNNSTNFTGLRYRHVDALINEIYEISQMKGFTCLDRHLRMMPYKKLISDNFTKIKEKLTIRKEYECIHRQVKFKHLSRNEENRSFRNRQKKIRSRKARKKSRAPQRDLLTQEELDYINELIKENQHYYDLANQTKEEEMKHQIMLDLIEYKKDAEKFGDCFILPENFYNKRAMRLNLPFDVHKRYTAIFYAWSHGTDLYSSLQFHFNQYHRRMKWKHYNKAMSEESYYSD